MKKSISMYAFCASLSEFAEENQATRKKLQCLLQINANAVKRSIEEFGKGEHLKC